jgi:hypothetical protein
MIGYIKWRVIVISWLYNWTTIFYFVQSAMALSPPPVSPAIIHDRYNRDDAVLVIVNESYNYLPQVIYAQNDGRAFRDFARNTLGIKTNWRTMVLENVSPAEIEASLKRIRWRTRRGGTVWVYYVGHGYVDNEGERLLVGVNATSQKIDEHSIRITDLILDIKTRGKAEDLVFIADADFGGIGREGLPVFVDRVPPKPNPSITSDPNVHVWLSDESTDTAPIFPQAQHGIFSYLMLGSLRGWSDGVLTDKPDGVITLAEAQTYVNRTAPALGVRLNPTVTTEAKAGEWEMRNGPMEAGPKPEDLESISHDLRARRFEDAASLIQAKANQDWQNTLFQIQNGGAEAEEALKEFILQYEDVSITVEWIFPVPELNEAHKLLQAYNLNGNIGDIRPEDCADLLPLEAKSIMGELSPSEVGCLEARIRLEQLTTEKERFSRLLITNAQVSNRTDDWERLMLRHLERIDRSDPNLTFAMTIFMYNKGKDHYREALKWADYALENRQRWEAGPDFTIKSGQLFEIRARMGSQIWVQSEQDYLALRSPENKEITQRERGQAKNFAREWLDYARAAGQPTKTAFDMCVSAAGSAEMCTE